MFGYVGGLVVFLSTFFKIVLHYTFRAFFLLVHWCHVKLSAREGQRINLPSIQDSSLQESIQEPFQYVEASLTNKQESEVTDDVLCNFHSSLDKAYETDELVKT